MGQTVKLRLSACPFSQFGTLPGVVSTISPDALSPPDSDKDNQNSQHNGGTFYAVMIQPQRLTLTAGQKECSVQSGIEGRADIVTCKETVLDFILQKTNLAIEI